MKGLFPRSRTAPAAAAIALVLLAFSALSCTAQSGEAGKGLAVTIAPQAEFAGAVAGDTLEITVMVPPGASPHTYEPTPSQIEALARAVLYAKVGSGVEFELGWMDKLASINKDMAIVDCSRGITLIETSAEADHSGPEPEHDHGTLDPHIWMSPPNAVIMVRNMTEGLAGVDPENGALYERNAEAYIARLEQLHRDIAQGLEQVRNRTFMVYHPSFGYFAREYGLTMLPIEEEGKEPTPAGLARVISQAKEHGIKVVFASPQFNPQSAEVIAEAIGGKVVFVDPLAENYIENMRTLAQQLIEAME